MRAIITIIIILRSTNVCTCMYFEGAYKFWYHRTFSCFAFLFCVVLLPPYCMYMVQFFFTKFKTSNTVKVDILPPPPPTNYLSCTFWTTYELCIIDHVCWCKWVIYCGSGECVRPAFILCCPVACQCIVVWCQVFVQYKTIKWCICSARI